MMKTTETAPAEEEFHWVVSVEDERDVEHNMPGYARRFQFDDPVEAWTCWASAVRAGFRARTEKVTR